MEIEYDEDEDLEELEEPEEDPVDLTTWKQASKKESDAIFRNPDTLEKVLVPIDYVNEKFITLYIRELPINEQLKLMELFMTFDKKGEAKFKWLSYYAKVYTMMVKKTEPKILWKEARFYNKKFMAILFKYLPNPMAFGDDTGISERERKNSLQLSEDKDLLQ